MRSSKSSDRPSPNTLLIFLSSSSVSSFSFSLSSSFVLPNKLSIKSVTNNNFSSLLSGKQPHNSSRLTNTNGFVGGGGFNDIVFSVGILNVSCSSSSYVLASSEGSVSSLLLSGVEEVILSISP